MSHTGRRPIKFLLRATFFENLDKVGDDEADMLVGHGDSEELNVDTNYEDIAKKLNVADLPSWIDLERVERGQKFYLRYSPIIGVILLHVSLAGGFGVPRVDAVLSSTAYLSNGNAKLVFKRLIETGEMVVDALKSPEGLVTVGGVGWKSVMKVRFVLF
jgi:hypothetical protein